MMYYIQGYSHKSQFIEKIGYILFSSEYIEQCLNENLTNNICARDAIIKQYLKTGLSFIAKNNTINLSK